MIINRAAAQRPTFHTVDDCNIRRDTKRDQALCGSSPTAIIFLAPSSIDKIFCLVMSFSDTSVPKGCFKRSVSLGPADITLLWAARLLDFLTALVFSFPQQ